MRKAIAFVIASSVIPDVPITAEISDWQGLLDTIRRELDKENINNDFSREFLENFWYSRGKLD